MRGKYAVIIFVTVAVVAAMAALGTVVLLRSGQSGAPTPAVPSGAATYRNETYGFEIAYPQELVPGAFERFHILSERWRAEAAEDQEGAGVIAIPVFRVDRGSVATGQPYPLYFTAEARVGVSDDPEAVAACLQDDPGYMEQRRETVTLDGVTFERFEFGGAAAMQYLQGVSYRTVRNGRCYAVEAVKAGSSYRDDSMPSGVPDEELDRYFSQAEEIARNFRFIR